MELHQLKTWINAGRCLPHMFVMSHAGLSTYSMSVEFKHNLEPITDKEGNAVTYSSLETVIHTLNKMGIEKATLRLIDPYDEFGPAVTSTGIEVCDEDLDLSTC
ncbi:DUF6482 family protein [Aliivibrio kagoshimensis]|uniref:DUF6482 family protein n=1 Tax=Aliivibrio kagoshimensis TaxID=2910230 RepID=UPI003D12C315